MIANQLYKFRAMKMLREIVNKKVVSEKELLRIFGNNLSLLNNTYQSLVRHGFNIKRRIFAYERRTQDKGAFQHRKNRVVIYYIGD